MAVTDTDAREARAAALDAKNLNGFDFVLVSLPGPAVAQLEVHFLNANRLPALLAASAPDKTLFPIRGGLRVRAGAASGEVQVTGTFVQVTGSLPISPAGLSVAETLTIAAAGQSVNVALPAGTIVEKAVVLINEELGSRARAVEAGGRLAVVAERTFDLAVTSSRGDPGNGRGTGFDTTPARPPADVLNLVVRPIGDYSTYTLGTGPAVPGFDPVFAEVGFKFRPGCFSTNCAPDWTPAAPAVTDPLIDYLAKDFDSFRHVAMGWMQARVPGWTPSSEADLSQMLLSLLSAAADELSDYQDRVMNEAYLATARSRVSLARHARLLDYHVHQGNQASAWVALELVAGAEILPGDVIEVWAGREEAGTPADDAAVFRGETPHLDQRLNAVPLYTWSGAVPGLAAGAVGADLAMPNQAAADSVAELIATGAVPRLLIQEHRDPVTGNAAGADPDKRQLLELDPGPAQSLRDPVTGSWYVSVAWREADRLRCDFTFAAQTPFGAFTDVSLFHGNVAEVRHGREVTVTFLPPGAVLAPGERSLEPTPADERGRPRWGTLAHLDPDTPLLYRDTPPATEVPPRSTLAVTDLGGEAWSEVISLVPSSSSDRHFIVETDELGRSTLRFGNGVNGDNVPEGGSIRCTYQTGIALEGNVGRDRIVRSAHPKLAAAWNPFDVTGARAPEPRDVILRNVPEAYAARQLRAITLGDYVGRAEEVGGVARAAAAYAWTGSQRTVRITIDPAGTDVLLPELRAAVAAQLEPLRLIGEDLEIRPPAFVPLRIVLSVCADPEIWVDDVRAVLEQEFSDGYTADGRLGFFNPDLWTFGQALYSSQILGRLEQVPGIAFARSVRLGRWDAPTPGKRDRIEVGPSEIVQVHNDPDHMEMGSIVFDLGGGRG
jgi:hypothetical protein